MVVCKSPAEIEKMRAANELVADILETLAAMVAPGITTADLDAEAEKLARAAGAAPAFKNYRGYPATLCTSINDQVVHGIPAAKSVLHEGDIVSIDMGVKMNGFFGDSAVTVPVGRVSESVTRLLDVTKASLEHGHCGGGGRWPGVGHRARRPAVCRGATGSAWCASSWGTGSGRRCTRSPRCRTTASAGAGRGCGWAWCWRSSPW